MTPDYRSLDSIVRSRLSTWPQHPPGFSHPSTDEDAWLRGRPSLDPTRSTMPYLKLPGGNVLRTIPDGLWLQFGGSFVEPFVDIFAIEACSTLPNFLDKRSRFAPSTHSMLAVCPQQWLQAPVSGTDDTPRWKATGIIRSEPKQQLSLPVRDMRVLYALRRIDYKNFASTQVPHPHEYVVPMETLTAEDGHANPAMNAMLSRASGRANILMIP